MVILVTGTICSGKHTFANFLQDLSQGEIINVDKLAHELYLPETDCYEEIVNHFGKTILAKNKHIDRTKLGQVVFKNIQQLQKLNQIIHPRLKKIIAEIIRNKPHAQTIIIVAALVKELDLRTDYVILLRTDLEKRKERLPSRQLDLKTLETTLKHQTESDDYDFLVENNESLEKLKEKATTIWKEIRSQLLGNKP
jgi:dephospho-CoA kinase